MGIHYFFSLAMFSFAIFSQSFALDGNYCDKFSSLLEHGFSMIKQHVNPVKKHRLIIFVHGTILPVPSVAGLKYVCDGLLSGQIESFEQAYNSYLRGLYSEGSCSFQPINDFGTSGLCEINLESSQNKSINSSLISKLVRDIFVSHNNLCGSPESMTTCLFGWGGELNHQKRIEWSEQLYMSIVDKCDEIRAKLGNVDFDIELFTHSHGGTVSLLLAQAQSKFNKNLFINRLIMLGTPIQQETESLVLDPMFKNVYLVYSLGDAVQIIDVISTNGRSRRRFIGRDEASKVIHIEVTIDGKNPSHGELWSYGMAGEMVYRKHLSIYPLPIVVFMPYVLDEIEKSVCSDGDNLIEERLSLKIDISRVSNFFVSKNNYTESDVVIIKYGYHFPLNKEIRIPLSILPESNKRLILEKCSD